MTLPFASHPRALAALLLAACTPGQPAGTETGPSTGTTDDPTSTSTPTTGDSTSTGVAPDTSTSDDSTGATSTGSTGSTTEDATSTSTGSTTGPGVDLPPVLESFLVDGTTAPPTVVAPAVLQLVAVASDDQAVVAVDFFLDDALLHSDDAAPFEAFYSPQSPADNGVHALRAVARDAAGQTDASDEIGVTVDLEPGAGGMELWSHVLPGEGVALATGPDFLVVAGTKDDQIWAERRALDDGALEWSETYGPGAAQDVAVLAAPTAIALGGFRSGAGWVGQLDGAGLVQWDTLVDPMSLEGLTDVRVAFSQDPELVVPASGYNGVDRFPRARARRFTLAGELVGMIKGGEGELGGAAVGPDSELAFAMSSYGLLGSSGKTLVSPQVGEPLWEAAEEIPREPQGAAIDGEGRVTTVGLTNFGVEDVDAELEGWIVQRDAAGVELWSATLGSDANPGKLMAVAAHPVGVLATTGRLAMDITKGAVITTKRSADGDELWTVEHVGTGDLEDELGRDVALDLAGAVYVLARESTPGGPQTRLIKYSP